MNTDDYTPESIKKSLVENGMMWTQARQDSFVELKDFQFRIESFPNTFLVAHDEKIFSMSRQERGEPDLRDADLLKTLDKILPEKQEINYELRIKEDFSKFLIRNLKYVIKN